MIRVMRGLEGQSFFLDVNPWEGVLYGTYSYYRSGGRYRNDHLVVQNFKEEDAVTLRDVRALFGAAGCVPGRVPWR